MKIYSHYGFNDFIICCGYKQHVIKEWFADYYLYTSDVTFDFTDNNKMIIHNNISEPWKVTLVDTGLNTMTGGRIKRILKYIENETFMLTYGDGVSDVNIEKLLKYHKLHGKLATLTAVNIAQRFGILDINDDSQVVNSFKEKADNDGSIMNAGFMVLEPKIFDYIEGDNTTFEKTPLENLAKDGQLIAFKHDGFWKCMDTKRDMDQLEEMWIKGDTPWKKW
jgi:glucose-1-phosphate cytidylyltransferase